MNDQNRVRKCTFCPNPTDGSDEHIIPDSLRGRLHSKEIICSSCNSNFGINIDPAGKEFFEPLLFILRFKNSKSLHATGIDNREYLYTNSNRATPLKPEKKIFHKEDQTFFSINGSSKNIAKMLQKLQKKGLVLKDVVVTHNNYSSPYLVIECKFNVTSKLNLLLNKIAVEFYSYHKLSLLLLEDIISRVYKLDEKIDNVKICNFKCEVRDINEEYISHLILLKNEGNLLYAYIELFNVLCAFIPLSIDYKGSDINISYQQDALSGKTIEDEISLKISAKNILENKFEKHDFDFLANNMIHKRMQLDFKDDLRGGLKSILEEVNKLVENGIISKDKFDDVYLERSTKFCAEFTIYDYPYMISDVEDEKDDYLNYIHSNFREEIVDEFINNHKYLIGLKIKSDNSFFTFDCFIKKSLTVKVNKRLVTIFCKLIHEETEEVVYIKVRDLFNNLEDGQ